MARYPSFPTHSIRPKDFQKLLNSSNVTYRAVHRRADLCPCFDTARGSPEYTCAVCGGIGYAWANPPTQAWTDDLIRGSTVIPELASKTLITPGSITATWSGAGDPPIITTTAVTLDEHGAPQWPAAGGAEPPVGTRYALTYEAPQQGRLHAQGLTKQRDVVDRGEIVAGHMDVSIPNVLEDLVTPNPAWQAAEHDRFIFPDLKHRHQARLTRGRRERLTYLLVRTVRSIRAILNGELVTFALDTDVSIAANGDVTWTNPNALPSGHPYVIDYIAAPEYYVWQELPQQRHIDGHDLPRRVGIRLFEQYPHRA